MSVDRPLRAVYPGSFDPVTLGHEDIARRALQLADEVVIAVAHTATQKKSGLFDIEARVEMLEAVFAEEPRIRVTTFEGLLVDFCRREGATVVLRGLRAVSDFEYELQMAQMNHELGGAFETVFLTPEARFSFLSASLVREVARLGGDVGRFVSTPVATRLAARFGATG